MIHMHSTDSAIWRCNCK